MMSIEERLERAGRTLDRATADYLAGAADRAADVAVDPSPARRRWPAAVAACIVLVALVGGVVLTGDDRGDQITTAADTAADLEPAPGWPGGVRILVPSLGLVPGPDGPARSLVDPEPQQVGSLTAAVEHDGGVLFVSWGETDPDAGVIGRPSLRRFDLLNGDDTEVVSSATSFAVSTDRPLAFARGIEPEMRTGVRYLTTVVVRDDADVEVPWTSGEHADNVLAWAGRTLLVQRDASDAASGALVAIDGPGVERVIARRAQLLAVAPSGDRVLVQVTGDDGAPRLELRRPADGATAGTVDVGSTGMTTAIAAVWDERTVIVSGALGASGDAAVVVFEPAGADLRARDAVSLVDRLLYAPGAIWSTGGDGSFAALAGQRRDQIDDPSSDRYVLLECDAHGSCLQRTVEISGNDQAGVVANPSRPRDEQVRSREVLQVTPDGIVSRVTAEDGSSCLEFASERGGSGRSCTDSGRVERREETTLTFQPTEAGPYHVVGTAPADVSRVEAAGVGAEVVNGSWVLTLPEPLVESVQLHHDDGSVSRVATP